jgi:acetolactate decarboxylase
MRRAPIRALAIAVSIVLASTCAPVLARADEPDSRADCIGSYCAEDTIYQFGPSAAFAASLFEGPTSFRDVLRLGDFGLGATSPLEGEVIILDGTAYQASPTGALDILPPSTRTPFAVVKHFRADRRVDLPEIADLDGLGHALDAALPSRNRFYAVRIEGQFDYVQLRSIPRQAPPYPELAEVVRGQNVFAATEIEGTLVGFRFPSYVGGVNASGWHFHFVDEARHLGGHVIDVRAGPSTAALDQSRSLTLILPDDPAFDDADLSRGGDGEAFQAAVRPEAPAPEATPTAEATPAEATPSDATPTDAASIDAAPAPTPDDESR